MSLRPSWDYATLICQTHSGKPAPEIPPGTIPQGTRGARASELYTGLGSRLEKQRRPPHADGADYSLDLEYTAVRLLPYQRTAV